MKKTLVFIFIFLVSCKPSLDYELRGYTQKIIVEGFIGADEYPCVYLSLNIPTHTPIDSSNVLKNVIRTAKVTVSDGTKTEILTSQWEKNRFPPYVYKGTELKGEEGKTYYLQVDYSGYTLNAATTIPHAPQVEGFTTLPTTKKKDMRVLLMNLNIQNKKNGFRAFTKKEIDKNYVQSPFVYNENLNLTGKNTFLISPQPARNDSSYKEAGNFRVNTSVKVKIYSIDSVSSQFFKSLTLFSANGFGKNIFIGESRPLPSNITKPGFGIWYGYSAKQYEVAIK